MLNKVRSLSYVKVSLYIPINGENCIHEQILLIIHTATNLDQITISSFLVCYGVLKMNIPFSLFVLSEAE